MGNTPSKKNSRVHTRTGISLPSKAFYDWQKDALKQVRIQTRMRFLEPVSVDVTIIFGTMARADLDNRVTSILDMLVEAFVLCDDKWQDVPEISARAVYKKREPGAIIRIAPIGKSLMVK